MKSKKGKIALVIGVLVIALAAAIGVGYSHRDRTSYYSVWKTILKNDLGTYRFALDVRTAEHEDGKDASLTDTSYRDVLTMEGVEDVESTADTQSEESEESDESEGTNSAGETGVTSKKDFGDDGTSWGSSDGSMFTAWQYPEYRFVIQGLTTSVEPFETSFTVDLTTANNKGNFTEVVVKDNKVYVDISAMGKWLKQSKDSYLIGLSESIPEGATYALYDNGEFGFTSRYAEEGEEEISFNSDTLNEWHRFTRTVLGMLETVESELGGKGLSRNKAEKIYSLELNNNELAGLGKTLIKNRGDVYDQLVTSISDLYTEKQIAQKEREKDNFLSATSDLYNRIMVSGVDDLGMKVAGSARQYTGGKNQDVFEAEFQTAYTFEGVDYNIALAGSRSSAGEEATKNLDSVTDFPLDSLNGVVYSLMDYCNVSGVELGKRLENTPDTIRQAALESFVDMVNNTDATETRISMETVNAFIEKYSDYEPDETTTPNDKINAQLVSDFRASISNLESKTIVQEEKAAEIDQFRHVSGEAKGVIVQADVDQEATTQRVVKIDLLLCNPTGKDVTLKLTDFTLKNMMDSRYPCNDEVTLRSEDNSFDVSLLKTRVKVKKGRFAKVSLYVAANNGLEYMDLMYGDEKLGDLIARK